MKVEKCEKPTINVCREYLTCACLVLRGCCACIVLYHAIRSLKKAAGVMSYAISLIFLLFLFLDGGAEKLLCAVGSRFLRLRLTQPEFCSRYVWNWTKSLSK